MKDVHPIVAAVLAPFAPGPRPTPAQRLARVMIDNLPESLHASDADEAGRFTITDNWRGTRYAVCLKPIDSAEAGAKEAA
ncbi:hypothetical protein E5163_14770 [Marinicauda algicola]|uniref:Uncharacterized protein n=1 Tax=Marinicauda algicola TaxID=2029849 RepID=A0A4S2GWR7_9PROT|nr:hypothetical protein [Marinicauda algicola]TGY87328.1 hypothetical protein E5163_14770 [Marinicauda algicola]